MLAVDDRGLDRGRFWTPSTVKPLNFNYDFVPNLAGQSIWTLTDGLFTSDSQRAFDDFEGQKPFRVIYSRAEDRKTQSVRAKKSSRYQHFPTINENFRQKSSPPSRPQDLTNIKTSISEPKSRNSRKVSSRSSAGTTPPHDIVSFRKTREPSELYTLARRNPKDEPKSDSEFKSKVLNVKPFARMSPRGGQKKKEGTKGKLNSEETDRLLKSLDFRVRTRKKIPPRDKSKSDCVRKSPFSPSPITKSSFQKRAVSGKKSKRLGLKNDANSKMAMKTSQNQLVRSSRKSWQTSSSESSKNKSMSSTSGLGELLGPLPRVKWTPEVKTPDQGIGRKKVAESSRVTLMKANKMKTAMKKNAEKSNAVSEDPAEIEGSSRDVATVRKVKTTPMKIIPKITINNQLLKSTTAKVDKNPKKRITPIPSKTIGGKKLNSSTLWTPEKIALLDKITSDQQLKAVLMSAGDTYLKSRRYLGFRNSKPTKTSQSKENSSQPVLTKNPESPETANTTKVSTSDLKGVSGKVNPMPLPVSNQPIESTQTSSFDNEEKNSKNIPQTTQKPKTDYQVKTKATVVVKNKAMKMLPRTGAGPHLASGKKEPNAGPKRRQKLVTTKNRMAQMSSEAAGPVRIQSDRMAQIRRSNLDTLKKILDKSLSPSNRTEQT